MNSTFAGSQPSESGAPNHSRVNSGLQSTAFPEIKVSWAIAIASLVALGITTYLVTVALTSSKIAGCGGGQIFDCNDVVNSRWSRWLGIPVSLLALGLYLSVFFATIAGSLSRFSARQRSFAWAFVTFGGLSAGIAAVWFTSLQFFVVKHLCTYCLAAHSCGIIISLILIWTRPLGAKVMRNIAMLSFVGIGVLIGGQLAFKPVTHQVIEFEIPADAETTGEIFEFTPPAVDDSASENEQSSLMRMPLHVATLNPTVWLTGLPAFQDQSAKTESQPSKATKPERRLIPVQGGSFQLDVKQWPLLGKPDAKYVFIEMFDYTCDHCRRTHAAIVGAKKKLGDDLAVIMLPVPLNTNCNSAITTTGPRMAEACEIAELAIAVWRVAPDKFSAFHEYLMTTPANPTYLESRSKAIEMLGTEKIGDQPSLAEKLEKELSGKTPKQYISQHVTLYKRVGAGTVPKLMFPGTTIVGEFTSGDALLDVINQQLK